MFLNFDENNTVCVFFGMFQVLDMIVSQELVGKLPAILVSVVKVVRPSALLEHVFLPELREIHKFKKKVYWSVDITI